MQFEVIKYSFQFHLMQSQQEWQHSHNIKVQNSLNDETDRVSYVVDTLYDELAAVPLFKGLCNQREREGKKNSLKPSKKTKKENPLKRDG